MIIRVCSIVLLMCVLVTERTPAAKADTTPQFVVDPANATSGITISHVTLLQTMPGGGYTECVFFTNTSARPVTRITFNFQMSDYKPAVFQTDVFDRRGMFGPGVENDGLDTMHQVFSKSRVNTCHDTSLRRVPDTVLVRVMHVEYDDKSTWDVPQARASPSPAPSASG